MRKNRSSPFRLFEPQKKYSLKEFFALPHNRRFFRTIRLMRIEDNTRHVGFILPAPVEVTKYGTQIIIIKIGSYSCSRVLLLHLVHNISISSRQSDLQFLQFISTVCECASHQDSRYKYVCVSIPYYQRLYNVHR